MTAVPIWPRNDYSRVRFGLYHDPEIPKPGDYCLTHVGETPIVLNRDQDGGINAFVNRCAHRGAEIVREPFGNLADFTCVYHAWCYSPQGDLIGVPFMKGVNGKGGMPPAFDMRAHGLTKLRVARWSGVVFGSFSDEAEPLEAYLG